MIDVKINDKFNKILVLGDIHSDLTSLMKAISFAKKNDAFIIFLGDLVDYGDMPQETLEIVHNLIVNSGGGASVIGNHDQKFIHMAQDKKKIKLSIKNQQTLDMVDKDYFISLYREMEESGAMSHILKWSNFVFTHAAINPTYWTYKSLNSTIVNMLNEYSLYGEVGDDPDTDGYPIRLYNWAEKIPRHMTVCIGHDRKPFGTRLTSPYIHTNDNGGRLVCCDTGCSKGGYLSSVLIDINTKDITNFISFI